MLNKLPFKRMISRELSTPIQKEILLEEMVSDERDQLSPSDFIQRKLQLALPTQQIPVSVLHLERFVRR
jgi:hypothetical protein